MDREKNAKFFYSLEKLNKYQREAVMDENRFLLVKASVGSGKTTVLVHKVLYLYLVKKIPLKDMVVLTFTNKAAEEIKDRVFAFSSSHISRKDLSYFGTFHSVARNLLTNVLPVDELGYTKDFSIIDEAGMEELFESIIYSHDLNIKYKRKIAKRLESLREGKLLYGNMKYNDEIQKLARILKEEKKKRNSMDFDDLIENTGELLKKGLFKPSWVIIDEFQDTDESQLKMIDGFIGGDTHVFAVGDPNQTIYTWRGSRVDIFDIFKDRYWAEEKTLPINYRSTGVIIDAAKAFLKEPQSLEGVRGEGKPIVVKRHYNSFNEALYLADRIKELHSAGVPYKEIAIFYRKQKNSQVFEDVFAKEGIPFEVSVRKNLKDVPVLYWLTKLIKGSINTRDKDSLLHVISDNRYGPSLAHKEAANYIKKLYDGQMEGLPLILQKIISFKQWCQDKKWELNGDFAGDFYEYFDIDSCISPTSIYYSEEKGFIMKFLKELEDYIRVGDLEVVEGLKSALDAFALHGSRVLNEIIDPEKESVKLMTLHASKGLEFKYVFISGANYGSIPIGGKLYDDEEQRLFFVGITRAKDHLEISYHSNPEDYNVLPEPSPYIKMIPDRLIESDELKGRAQKLGELKREIKNKIDKKSEKDIGHERKVRHPKYGDGIIIEEDDEMVRVNFAGYGEKFFSKLFCPLEYLS